MSRKTTKSILSRDEISLLINSEETKNTELYGNLYSILSNLQNMKAVTLEQLASIDTKAKAALTYNKKTLIDTTIKEWYAESVSEEDPTKKVRCGLCNTPNKYLYYIKNRKNNIVLNVGSHCITKFPGIEGYTEQKKQLDQIHKGHKIVQRRNEFYSNFPDYEDFISNAEKYFSALPILLPYELYTSLQGTIERMRLIATKYINEGKKPYNSKYNSFQLFQLAINQYNKLKIESEVHIATNGNNLLSCQRSEIDWMISHNKQKLLEEISQNNGIYTLQTLKYIGSINYLKNHFDLIFEKNQSQLLKFERFDGENIIFSFIKFGYQPSLIFSTNINDFMKNIGANCIINKNYKFDSVEILNTCKIMNLKDNVISILDYIENIIDKFGYAFLMDETTNSLILIRKGDKAIRYFKPYDFISSYSKKLLLTDKSMKEYLHPICKGSNNTNWITKDIQEKQGIDVKVDKLYKAYKSKHDAFY